MVSSVAAPNQDFDENSENVGPAGGGGDPAYLHLAVGVDLHKPLMGHANPVVGTHPGWNVFTQVVLHGKTLSFLHYLAAVFGQSLNVVFQCGGMVWPGDPNTLLLLLVQLQEINTSLLMVVAAWYGLKTFASAAFKNMMPRKFKQSGAWWRRPFVRLCQVAPLAQMIGLYLRWKWFPNMPRPLACVAGELYTDIMLGLGNDMTKKIFIICCLSLQVALAVSCALMVAQTSSKIVKQKIEELIKDNEVRMSQGQFLPIRDYTARFIEIWYDFWDKSCMGMPYAIILALLVSNLVGSATSILISHNVQLQWSAPIIFGQYIVWLLCALVLLYALFHLFCLQPILEKAFQAIEDGLLAQLTENNVLKTKALLDLLLAKRGALVKLLGFEVDKSLVLNTAFHVYVVLPTACLFLSHYFAGTEDTAANMVNASVAIMVKGKELYSCAISGTELSSCERLIDRSVRLQ